MGSTRARLARPSRRSRMCWIAVAYPRRHVLLGVEISRPLAANSLRLRERSQTQHICEVAGATERLATKPRADRNRVSLRAIRPRAWWAARRRRSAQDPSQQHRYRERQPAADRRRTALLASAAARPRAPRAASD